MAPTITSKSFPTGVRRLQVALTLAETDLSTATEAETTRLLADTRRFILAAPRSKPGADTGGFWFGSTGLEPEVRDLFELQERLRPLFSAVASARPMVKTEELLRFVVDLRFEPIAVGRNVVVSVHTQRFTDSFMFCVLALLAKFGTSRVQPCQECGLPFIKAGRRIYCVRPACETKRAELAFSRYAAANPDKVKAARESFYAKHGWTLGARGGKFKTGKAGTRQPRKSRTTKKGDV